MSVKDHHSTVGAIAEAVAEAAHGDLPGTKGHHPISAVIGTAITGGRANAGTKGYLAAYLKQLESNPLRTKMLTAGTLAGSQELLASWLAKDRNKNGNYFTARVPKMATYGALVSAPLGHFLIWILQKMFQNRKSLRAKILQILVSNLIVAPIQNSVYLVAMAIIAGAKTWKQVQATVRVGFWKVMKVSWLSSPLCLAFAQKFLPEAAWMPFFNLVSFFIGTYINYVTKKKRLAALRRKHFGDGAHGDHRHDRERERDRGDRERHSSPPHGHGPSHGGRPINPTLGSHHGGGPVPPPQDYPSLGQNPHY
ncbi:hypothetical protein SMACR_02120 [Sordaria macrospora]|uniref:WGS project CABT00000000 data, contig 2.18 n=2 Tax=Sordaria macrospora TaxID=5147 RepID=F7W111_SORMK|nr:uncharacterized protein SMAC_02120 [Sordaria macrospora k-hell]KAA8633273.1 hypothetical protein SMACR_02120 [Sordaria macrospora]KAH7629183.1 hypothetical protein B0T09DRAFT_152589 [Sordaria sp. MPI-SDFR-AT-0083]WPJ63792.1 hypothetical protein SMAC4_02120 [Sordaria macrospora]CCC11463.1 unnamed protein product [Sordaria macrospora k-hell]